MLLFKLLSLECLGEPIIERQDVLSNDKSLVKGFLEWDYLNS